MLDFNRGTSQPVGICPKLPITLGGNTIYIDVITVQVPLDFNLLLWCDYVYVMGALVSSLFHVMCFPHEGRIVIIDQLSFVGPNLTPSKTNSLNGPYIQVVSSSPQVIYVETYPINVPTPKDGVFSVCSTSFDLDLVGDMVNHLLGALESDLSIGSFDPFQSVVLLFNENLLEAMVSWRP